MSITRCRFVALLWALAAPALHSQAVDPKQDLPALEVRVVHAVTGEPLPDVRLRVASGQHLNGHGEPAAHFATSGADGRARFEQLPPGHYSILAHAAGMELDRNRPVYFDLIPFARAMANPAQAEARAVDNCENCLVILPTRYSIDEDGSPVAILEVKLAPITALSGRVIDPQGLPLGFASVRLYRKEPLSQAAAGYPQRPRPNDVAFPDGSGQLSAVRYAMADDRGEFRFAHLAPGSYYVWVGPSLDVLASWSAGYRATFFPRALDAASAGPISIATGQQTRVEVQIVAQRGVRVAGRLSLPPWQAPDPATRRYTRVSLTSAPPRTEVVPFTTVSGDAFELDDIPPGAYTLTAITFDRRIDQPLGVGNRRNIFGVARQIEVGESDKAVLDLQLSVLPDISGTVTFANGCPRSVVVLGGWDAAGNPAVPGQSDVNSADGSFTLRGLVPGHIFLNPMRRFDGGVADFDTHWTTVRLGDRDIKTTGFDYPPSGNEPLRIEIGCPSQRAEGTAR